MQLTLRGVAGFGDVLFRLVATLDAELSQAKAAEEVFVTKWQHAVGRNATLSSKAPQRLHKLAVLLKSLQMPAPHDVGLVENFLISRGLLASAPASDNEEGGPPETTTPAPPAAPPSCS